MNIMVKLQFFFPMSLSVTLNARVRIFVTSGFERTKSMLVGVT